MSNHTEAAASSSALAVFQLAMAAAFMTVPSVVSATAVRSVGSAVGLGETIDPAVVARLSERLRKSICALPKAASAEDVEAAMMFELSQSGSTRPVMLASLKRPDLNSCGAANFGRALINVESALLKRKGVGTASLSEIGIGGYGFSPFSAPAVAIGGGATYSQ